MLLSSLIYSLAVSYILPLHLFNYLERTPASTHAKKGHITKVTQSNNKQTTNKQQTNNKQTTNTQQTTNKQTTNKHETNNKETTHKQRYLQAKPNIKYMVHEHYVLIYRLNIV